MSRDMRSVSATMRSSVPAYSASVGTLARDLRGRPHHRDGASAAVRRVAVKLRRPPTRPRGARTPSWRSRQAIRARRLRRANRKTLRQVVGAEDLRPW